MKKLLTTNEAATILGVSRQFLERDRWLSPNKPHIPYVRIGARAVRYAPDALQAYIEAHTAGESIPTTKEHQ